MHIVEEMIAERAQKLRSRPWLYAVLRPIIFKILGYKDAVAMADTVASGTGFEAFAHVSKTLRLTTKISGLDNIPANGAVMIISNHPTGLADGIYVFDALKAPRRDHIFMANADALRVIPNCEDIIIPVEWVKEKRTPAKTRATLMAMKAAIKDERAIVIFPSGVLAKMTKNGLRDQDWNPTAISIAKKYGVPIVPLKVKSKNSALYYLLAKLNGELRDITLFHELLNKKGQRPELIFGKVIDPATLPRISKDATAVVRAIVEAL